MSVFLKAFALLRRARATYGVVSSARKLEHLTSAIMWLDLRSVKGFSVRWGKSALAQQLAQFHEIQALNLLCARVPTSARNQFPLRGARRRRTQGAPMGALHAMPRQPSTEEILSPARSGACKAHEQGYVALAFHYTSRWPGSGSAPRGGRGFRNKFTLACV